ncbi:DUF5996 family protein [Kitasatospora sp. NBC_01287]|uniref:DUF5996 family protein n=1 Tax=Kitasatospora sp. NBC_01287 TaxID=2903573 RepID=UPI00225C3926|nr:DUF5996 family protein [Kitasatospora sp. NBC_01287]MCX4747182.1 DUF5996 family protein [Kitasatospora sp. NBC_01287]
MTDILPDLPFEAWRPTKETLHRFAQVVGKVALAQGTRRNHWWHITYRLTARGWTTVPLGDVRRGPVFTITFDFFDHALRVACADGRQTAFALTGQSVASFHANLLHALRAMDIDADFLEKATPYDLPDKKRPFAQDTEHTEYDPVRAQQAFQVLSRVGAILEEFSAGFSGKVSPVQLFWHSFDLAVTRFSDRQIDMPDSVDAATREAYSREVVSAGFWYGDDKIPEPSFYTYTAPEPPGVTGRPLYPAGARWMESGSGHMASYSYADARAAAKPVAAVLGFLQSAYVAGAELAGWDVQALTCFGGVTDPVLKQSTRHGWPEWPHT